MTLILQLITSFLASAAFVVIFNAPRRTLLQCGLSGMLGWAAYYLLTPRIDTIFATVTATFIVGVISQFFARIYKKPVIIFSVAGIIPLVPGGLAYDAMRRFVENNYDAAIQLAAQAFLISGSIAIGLVISEVLNQLIRKLPIRVPNKLRNK
ncbi:MULTISPECIES: threonine/serine exporter family protein [unclassified Paenibacillus]|uniref:threonine/serine exporter family protein n=1 Tax=unclassified Paenibacillus TaxID=185978 RepID=UPI000839B57F|nr:MULTISPECIES: threonine/serine exporter family protein [unclassified Paenibacillus]NWL89919.1 threonine/serine exporter [Paenibacillus sp. 79R4]